MYNKMTTVLSSKIYAAQINLTSGIGGGPFFPNLNGSSRFLSVRRTTAVGTPGTPTVQFNRPSLNGGFTAIWGIEVYSSSALDDSFYDVLWVNDYIPSQYLVQGGSLAGAQFSP